MSDTCVECGVEPKAPNAHKYCVLCKIIVAKRNTRASDKRMQKKRRMKNYSPCAECNEKFTYTKYCNKCSHAVHRRMNAERIQAEREKNIKKCDRCGEKDRWSTNSTTKYCMECKAIVQKEKIQEKNKIRDKGKKVRRTRKKPVQKGISLDPTSQQPKIVAPKMKKKDGSINPYFLRRGDPANNGTQSGFTQFNQE